MTPFDPILHDHEKRMAALEAARRSMEESLIVMDAIQRRHATNIEAFEEFIAEQIQYDIERDRKHEEWKTHHELAMKEFDEKLNGLIAWLDDFVRRNPSNGK